MVIYQKQPRVAHRQYCTVLQQNRLTGVPPPSQKAFFPSSWVSCVNIHYGIKTAFSSAWSGIHFRSFCFQREQSTEGEGRGREERDLVYFWGVKILSLGIYLPGGSPRPISQWQHLIQEEQARLTSADIQKVRVSTHHHPTPVIREHRGNLDFQASQLPVRRRI